MAFHVPEEHAGVADEVERRFGLLLCKNIITGVSETKFNKWLSNFITDEDKYFAARLLENLTFRSEAMVRCAIDHILQCILPGELRRAGVEVGSVDAFLESVRTGQASHPVRFVEVADAKGRQPGKSGPVLMRELHRLSGVSNSLLCYAEHLGGLPKSVKCLVFVDDMLGTGTQFKGFADAHALRDFAVDRQLLYCPLAAYKTGLEVLGQECNWLKVCPVEEFGGQHRFFRELHDAPGVWAIDGRNTVEDAREHMRGLCDRAGIRPEGRYGLELLIGFHHATPNNTLKIMYENSRTWNNLLTR